MAAENKDVLRIEASTAALPSTIRDRQSGFENDALYRMAHKFTGGTVRLYEQYSATKLAASHALDDSARHSIGSLTTNYHVKSDGSKLVPSLIFDDGTNVGIGTTSPATLLEVKGATEQLRLTEANGTDKTSFTSASGNLTIAPSGGTLNVYGILSKTNPAANNLLNIYGSTESHPLFLELDIYGNTSDPTQYCATIQFQEAGVGYNNISLQWAGGNLLVGTKVSTGGLLELNSSTEQFRLTNGSTHCPITLDSSGNLTIAPYGGLVTLDSTLRLSCASPWIEAKSTGTNHASSLSLFESDGSGFELKYYGTTSGGGHGASSGDAILLNAHGDIMVGVPLKLNNAYVYSCGIYATGYVTLKDSTGTSYKVLVVAA